MGLLKKIYINFKLSRLCTRYPIVLFERTWSMLDERSDSVDSSTTKILMKSPGKLIKEDNYITYSAHSIRHNTGLHKTEEEISFEELQKIIPSINNYYGMNETNWKDYIFNYHKRR